MPSDTILDERAMKRKRQSPSLAPCDTCGKMVTTGGWGRMQHMRIHNRPTDPLVARARFERGFDIQPNGCWMWRRTCKGSPYGSFYFAGRYYMTFIFSWWLYRGEIVKYPPLVLDHTCQNKPCVNPDHLEPVTQSENMKRAKWTPACPQGHLYTPENTRLTKIGRRTCVQCCRARGRAFYAKHSEEINAKDRAKRTARRAAGQITV